MDNGHLFLSGIRETRMFRHREINGSIKTCTIKKDKVGDWWACFSVEEDGIPRKVLRTVIGIDLGLENLAVLSTDETIGNPRFLRKQRDLRRKKTGSHNREKARIKLAGVERRIEFKRNDFLHKVSRDISRKVDVVIFEDLNIKNMVQNHGLAKSISDASWGRLVQYTCYKVEETGGEVVLVDPRNTQKCSRCGEIVHKSLSQRIHMCPHCGLTADRDYNASLNILRSGWNTALVPAEKAALPAKATAFFETGSLEL